MPLNKETKPNFIINNFLDIPFNLTNKTSKLFRKDNKTPTNININSNHPQINNQTYTEWS